jgi:hypothetical protein
MSGNKNNIPSRSNLAPFQSHSHRLAHPAFDPITVHGVSETPSNGETETTVSQTVGLDRENQKRVGPSAALTPETFKVSVCSKTVLPTHDVPGRRPYATRRAFTDLYCQAMATFLSPGLEDSASSPGFHSSPKAVYALATTHLGLPCSFRHYSTSPVWITTRNYTLFSRYLQIPRKA